MNPDEIRAYVDKRIDDKMEAIADLAVKKAWDQLYKDVGKGVLRKAAWVIGVAVFALFIWLAGGGYVKP